MAQQTRVEKYAKLREDIARMDDANRINTPYQVPTDKDGSSTQMENDTHTKYVGKRTRSLSLDDIFAAHEAYNNITGQDDSENKKAFEEKQEKLEKRNRIIIISLFGVAFAIFILLLIYFIVS